MIKMKEKIKLIPPIGEVPPTCPRLREMLNELSDDAPLSDIFKVFSKWEKWAIKEHRKMEQTKNSGILTPRFYDTPNQRKNLEVET